MENLDPYLNKFSESGRRVLEGALDETRRRHQHYVSPEHILYALIVNEPDLFNSQMQNLSANPNTVRFEVERLLQYSRVHTGPGFRISPQTTEIFKYSMDRARSQNRRVIEASDILYALISDRNSLLNNILQNADSSSETISLSGQVRQIDLDAKQIVLRNTKNSELKEVRCVYQAYSDKQATEWLNKFVIVTGAAEKDAYKNIYLLRIENVEIDNLAFS